jgi:membrane-bound metal-dependent hydrolase YbcI (DUF457 family)
MPLAGSCAWPLVPAAARARSAVKTAIIVGAIGAAPDLDLLVNDHRGPAHSLGAAIIAGLVVWIVTRRAPWGTATGAAWASHVLLDWLGADTRPPIGIMALWPVSTAYFQSPLQIFPAISRRYWLREFWYYNAKAVAVEVAILLPIATLIVWAFRRRAAS